MDRTIAGRRLELVRGDITRQQVDCIVNAANSSLLGGGGVDGAIHRAGGRAIHEECMAIRAKRGGCQPGKAVSTTAGSLAARRIIHTVGPIWHGGTQGEAEVLADCYRNALALAVREGHATIAFPSIGTGAYAYPLERAAAIAVGTVAAFLGVERKAPGLVRFVLFDDRTFDAYAAALSALFPLAE